MSAESLGNRIASIAVLDLETTNLPALNFNKVSITELSIYGFAANELTKQCKQPPVPSLPRIVHKLSLLFNPQRLIHPEAEVLTGLNNYALEHESTFDDNAAATIVGFFNHLRKPVCLVAHNGHCFDYPILKKVFNRTNIQVPGDILCIDSLVAFRAIDKSKKVSPSLELCPYQLIEVKQEDNIMTEETSTLQCFLSEVEEKNWAGINETTPKRSLPNSNTYGKRIKTNYVEEDTIFTAIVPRVDRNPRARRALFNDSQSKLTPIKGSPRRGMYKLGELYERIFDEEPKHAHFAEGDVEILTKLLLYYGADFLDYAIENAIPFVEIVPLAGK